MAPDRTFAPEIMGMNLVPCMRALQDKGVTMTIGHRLKVLTRDGNQLSASIGTDCSDHRKTANYDQVVFNHGTPPLDDLYFELKPLSSNLGAMDDQLFIDGQPQCVGTNPDGQLQLFRIGDAVSSRNTHAAIYGALRLIKDI